MKFTIGEDAIALSNPMFGALSQPRIKGKTYKVLAVQYCTRCGIQSINVAGRTPEFYRPLVSCDCGSIQNNEGLWWTNSTEFIKPEDVQQAIEAAVEIEDYEFAQTLSEL